MVAPLLIEILVVFEFGFEDLKSLHQGETTTPHYVPSAKVS